MHDAARPARKRYPGSPLTSDREPSKPERLAAAGIQAPGHAWRGSWDRGCAASDTLQPTI
jgi:hypothetical protein